MLKLLLMIYVKFKLIIEIFEGTFINVQQLNRGFKAMDRRCWRNISNDSIR